jgi:hypothetical protein
LSLDGTNTSWGVCVESSRCEGNFSSSSSSSSSSFFFEEEGEEVDERDFQYTLGFWHSRLHNILYDGMLLWRIWGLLFTPLAKEKR